MQTSDKVGWQSGAAIVIANMIGTGVFTGLGFQLESTQNSWSILILWVMGGMIALSGAFCYAELGTFFKRSGGEYHYLGKLYHPLVGYLSGWVSLTVGFAAPVALAAVAMGAYLREIAGIDPRVTASIAVLAISVVHSVNLKQSSGFQIITTLLKVLLIVLFIVLGLVMTPAENAFDWSPSWQEEIVLPAFAVSLIYVTYSYSGWNAAAYITEEMQDLRKNLPKALVRGTFVVTILYLLLHIVFLRQAGLDQLQGKIEIGQVVAKNMLGQNGGMLISMAIALFLISSISAMTWVGPRVSMVMAEDHKLWKFLSLKNKRGIPVRAVWFQTVISLFLIWTGTFEQVLLYCGFILQLMSALTVAGTFLVRTKRISMVYRNPAHPWLTILFILVSIWIIGFLIYERPVESAFGAVNLVIGWITWLISEKLKK